MSSDITSIGPPKPPQPRTIVLRKMEGTPDLQTRLLGLGFSFISPRTLVNADNQANIQRITLAHDFIDARKWDGLIVQACRPDHIEEDLQALGLCQAHDIVTDQQTKDELERDLRQKAQYYEKTIRPYLNDPMRDLIEWYVADRAYHSLRDASDKASKWNDLKEGERFPVPKDAFPDLDAGFRVPELIGDKDYLKQQLQTLPPAPAGLSPAEAVNWAVKYHQELEALPKEPTDNLDMHNLWLRPIPFAQITSNNETQGSLPLLPPVPTESDRLSVDSIKQIALEWQKNSRAPISDDLESDQIPLMYLCDLRYERFRIHGGFAVKRPSRTPQRTQTASDYLTSLDDAAKYIGVTRRTISTWKRRGWLKVEQDGRKIRIARSDLDKCKRKQ